MLHLNMPTRVDYGQLPTEQPNPRSRDLDRLSPEAVLRLITEEDARVPRAVVVVVPAITEAVSLIVSSLRAGGRLFFIGAGTSGRLGVIEAAECPPTFNTPPSMIQALIAGGKPAVFRSREGAEDDRVAARRAISRRVRRGDVAVGIAASGVTPFVDEGLREAARLGARTIVLTCNPRPQARRIADVVIAPDVGPELVTGSTRMKAGTATKLVLNMLTIGVMVQLGKVHGHWMVDMRPTSRKLRARALRIIQTVAAVPAQRAAAALRRAGGEVKAAIVIAARGVDRAEALRLLAEHDGMLRGLVPERAPTRRTRRRQKLRAASAA